MAAPALNLDLSGIAIGQPRVPDPIATALAAIQTTINSLGNIHIAADATIAISKTELAIYIAPTNWATPLFYKNDNATLLSATVRRAKYWRVGKMVCATVHATGIGDPSGVNLWMTLPISAAFDATYTISCGSGANTNGTTNFVSYALIGTSNGDRVALRLGADNTWGVANNSVIMHLCYEAV